MSLDQKSIHKIDPQKSIIENRINLYAALSFLVITLAVGLPIWWKTTEVYRAPLPYDVIEHLSTTNLTLQFAVNFLHAEFGLKHQLYGLKDRLDAKLSTKRIHERLSLHFRFRVKELTDDYKKMLILADKFDQFDVNYLSSDSNEINLIFFTSEDVFGSKNNFSVHLGSRNNFFLKFNEKIDSTVEKCLLEFHVDQQKLAEIFVKHFDKRLFGLKTKFSHKKMAFSSKIPKPTLFPEYSVEFTVISPDSSMSSDQIDGLHQFFRHGFTPFSSALHNLTTLHFKSQILHFLDFEHSPLYDNFTKSFFYKAVQLPHLISGFESYTGGFEIDRKTLHFLIYFTPENLRPLHVLNDRGEKSPDNGFIVTGWGGVLVLNPPPTNQNASRQLLLDKKAKDALFTQLLALLGFAVAAPPRGWSRASPAPAWDMRRLKYEAVLDYCMGSVATLTSLNKLLAEITNIVISDHVSESIDIASENVEKSIKLLSGRLLDERDLNDAYWSAKISRDQSEKAFFDPSLLALLYFPDDQKYAIYVPLFLPVLLPIFMSIFFVVKYLKNGQ